MEGVNRLKEMVAEQKDSALKKVVDYLISRIDLDAKYINEEKNLKDMVEFIQQKGRSMIVPNWNYINDEVVFSWAVMYFCFPNSFLKINKKEEKKEKTNTKTKKNVQKDNVISLEKVKEEKKKEVEQISLFGGI